MTFGNLRIAFSIACGSVGLLFLFLWVRSYWWRDAIVVPLSPTTAIGWQSVQGQMVVSLITDPNFVISTMREPWDWHAMSIEKWERLLRGPKRSSTRAFPSLLFRRFIVSNDAIAIPYWFLALLAAAAAAAPWFAWSRRFSLRVLFVVMTLVAGMLGLIFYVGH